MTSPNNSDAIELDIYGMFRAIVRSCGMGGMAQEVNALNLIDALERYNAFGSIARITSASHQFINASGSGARIQVCGLCGRTESEHDYAPIT